MIDQNGEKHLILVAKEPATSIEKFETGLQNKIITLSNTLLIVEKWLISTTTRVYEVTHTKTKIGIEFMLPFTAQRPI